MVIGTGQNGIWILAERASTMLPSTANSAVVSKPLIGTMEASRGGKR